MPGAGPVSLQLLSRALQQASEQARVKAVWVPVRQKSHFFFPLAISHTENTACTIAVTCDTSSSPRTVLAPSALPLCLANAALNFLSEISWQRSCCLPAPRSEGTLCVPHRDLKRPQSVPHFLLLSWPRTSNTLG